MKSLKEEASKRIKTSLILSAFGDEKIQGIWKRNEFWSSKTDGHDARTRKIVQEYYKKILQHLIV